MPYLKVGIWLYSKKKVKLNLPNGLFDLCRDYDIEIIEIDMEKNLDEQGPFDIILHKILEQNNEDVTKGTEYFEKLKSYIESHRNIKVIDPISTGIILANRMEMLQSARGCGFTMHGKRVFVPNFVSLQTSTDPQSFHSILEKNDIKFPIIVKHEMAACYGKQVHDMGIIFCKENLFDLKPPCVVQQFHSHNGVMLKIYTIGDKYYLVTRPSIKNLQPGSLPTIFFNSCGISKHGTYSPLHDSNLKDLKLESKSGKDLIEEDILQELLQRLHSQFEFNLLGIDIIVDSDTGDYGILDINYFPGYDGVKSHVPQDLVELFLKVSNLEKSISTVTST